jgi:hypothetical protein
MLNTTKRFVFCLTLAVFFQGTTALAAISECSELIRALVSVGYRDIGGGALQAKNEIIFREVNGRVVAYRVEDRLSALKGVKLVEESTKLSLGEKRPYMYHTTNLVSSQKKDGKVTNYELGVGSSGSCETETASLPTDLNLIDSYFASAGFEKIGDNVFSGSLKSSKTDLDGKPLGPVETKSVLLILDGTRVSKGLVETGLGPDFEAWLRASGGKLLKTKTDLFSPNPSFPRYSFWPFEIQSVLIGENDFFTFELGPLGTTSIRKIKGDAAEIPLELLLQGKTFSPFTEPGSDFVVGGVNSSETIKKIKTLNGRQIEALEADMRPDGLSGVGFLGPNERLVDVLVSDNDWVRGQSGLTHQILSSELKILSAIGSKHKGRSSVFIYKGQKFRITRGPTLAGSQTSPFADKTSGSSNIVIENLTSKSSIDFSPLLIPMIERYGFYEGLDSPYRLDPKKILEVLTFLKK